MLLLIEVILTEEGWLMDQEQQRGTRHLGTIKKKYIMGNKEEQQWEDKPEDVVCIIVNWGNNYWQNEGREIYMNDGQEQQRRGSGRYTQKRGL